MACVPVAQAVARAAVQRRPRMRASEHLLLRQMQGHTLAQLGTFFEFNQLALRDAQQRADILSHAAEVVNGPVFAELVRVLGEATPTAAVAQVACRTSWARKLAVLLAGGYSASENPHGPPPLAAAALAGSRSNVETLLAHHADTSRVLLQGGCFAHAPSGAVMLLLEAGARTTRAADAAIARLPRTSKRAARARRLVFSRMACARALTLAMAGRRRRLPRLPPELMQHIVRALVLGGQCDAHCCS